MSSTYSAGVPIKKRRFPLIRPSSPPPEEQSVGNDSLQKGNSSPSQGSALSNASIPLSNASISRHEEQSTNVKMVHGSSNNHRVKVEEPSLTIHSVCKVDIDSKEKLVGAEKSANMIKSAKTELNLAPIGAPALTIGKELSGKQKVEERSRSEIPKTSGFTELSLGIKEHLLSSIPGHNGEGSHKNQESGGPIPLNLSLIKGETSYQCKGDNVEMNTNADMHANRSNWDLNTTMDAWDGSVSDEAARQVTVDRFNSIGGRHDIKPLICSVGILGDVVTSKGQILEKNKSRSDGAISSTLSCQPCNTEDNLHLGLSPSFLLSNPSQNPASSSAMLSSSRGIANSGLGKAFELTGSLNKVDIRTIKSEPLDESIKHDFKRATAISKGLLDIRAVKCELVDRLNPEALKSLQFSALKSVDPRSIKPEPVHEDTRETLKKTEGTLNQSDKQMSDALDIRGKTTSSVALSTTGDVSNSFEHSLNSKGSHMSGEVPQEKSESARQVLTEIMSVSVGHDGNALNVSSMVEAAVAEDKNIDDTEKCRLKLMDEVPSDSPGNGEGSPSDEEKINLSGDMLEEDSYGSDCESDANHNLDMDVVQDDEREEDFEDGEVREPLEHTEAEGSISEKREPQHFNIGDSSDSKQLDLVGNPSDYPPTSSYVEDKHTKTEEPNETNNDNRKELADTAHDEKTDSGNKDAILQEPLAGEMPTNEADHKGCVEASPVNPVTILKMKDGRKCQETEQSSDQATSASQGNAAAVSQGLDEDVKGTDVVEKNVSPLPQAEASLNVDDIAKDANSGGNKSRIITLPRASNMLSPGQTSTIQGRSLPSRAGRERLSDVSIEGDILHPRGRDEIYTDGSHKFSRERHQDQPSRNSRLNFVRGRGRISSRIDTLHGNWNSEREFAPEFYNGPAEFHVPRHKYASDPDPEFNSYNIGLNGAFVGTGRGGRKLLNDEVPVFRHLPSRRSPGGRVGHPGRGLEMVRRVRNISSSGCIGEGSELVGLRRGEKFMRGLPNDNTDPVYAHPQAPYEGLDGHFVRSNRNFLPMQRRGFPEIRPKSPIGRTRSPGTWSSPRRRSPDGFGGHPELPNRRSPPIYRMERMRSDHSCFPGEMVVRRHGSPYMSRPPNELRDMDSSRDLGHPRSAIPNRSPSGRVLLRNTRRFDIVDPRERTESDDYFGRPMHSGRFQELGGDGTGEERRRFGERRGPVRPFRPPYNGADCDNFHLNAGDGPRPFRFCPEDGPEFHERGNLREREFDRRIKNRPGNAPRRTRNIEEQEGNYRHAGQVWHDNEFDDMSRIKRKKF